MLLLACCVAAGAARAGGEQAVQVQQETSPAALGDRLERLAERHALRRVHAGSDEPVTRMLATRDPTTEAASSPVDLDEARTLLADLPRSGDGRLDSDAALIEFILQDSPALPALAPMLASLCADRALSGASRAACFRLRVRVGSSFEWVPGLLTADVPEELAHDILEFAATAPAIRARVMARCFVLRHVAEDSHLRVNAAWFAYRHADDPGAAALLPVLLLVDLAGARSEPLARAKTWGPETEALIAEAWSVHREAEALRSSGQLPPRGSPGR